MDTLRLYLQRTTPFNDLELLKLWKGFYYCMWMTANPLPQQRLAQDLSALVTQTLAQPNVLPFLDAFWQTMSREWANIDSLRMDKYLRLCRLMLSSSFAHLKATGYDEASMTAHNQLLERTPLNPEDAKIPNGLRYHVLDIYVDELERTRGDNTGDTMPNEVVQTLLEPVSRTLRESKTKPVRKRASEALSDPRLFEWGLEMQSVANGTEHDAHTIDEDGFGGFDD